MSNPGRCSKCNHAYYGDGKPLDIHWHIVAQAWVCLRCYFEVQQDYL